MDHRESNEFRRIKIAGKLDRANGLITGYRDGIDFWRDRMNTYHQLLGRISERLGEPEPEEP